MIITSQNKTALNPDTKLALLVFGIPIAGLIYCGLAMAAMFSLSFLREHALTSGTLFIFIPFSFAASIWLRASAKAYRN